MELKLREETVAKLTAQVEELSEKHGESTTMMLDDSFPKHVILDQVDQPV